MDHGGRLAQYDHREEVWVRPHLYLVTLWHSVTGESEYTIINHHQPHLVVFIPKGKEAAREAVRQRLNQVCHALGRAHVFSEGEPKRMMFYECLSTSVEAMANTEGLSSPENSDTDGSSDG